MDEKVYLLPARPNFSFRVQLGSSSWLLDTAFFLRPFMGSTLFLNLWRGPSPWDPDVSPPDTPGVPQLLATATSEWFADPAKGELVPMLLDRLWCPIAACSCCALMGLGMTASSCTGKRRMSVPCGCQNLHPPSNQGPEEIIATLVRCEVKPCSSLLSLST
jgi:hypothetical protein